MLKNIFNTKKYLIVVGAIIAIVLFNNLYVFIYRNMSKDLLRPLNLIILNKLNIKSLTKQKNKRQCCGYGAKRQTVL
jgi:uncharacterized membrane protein